MPHSMWDLGSPASGQTHGVEAQSPNRLPGKKQF